MCSTGLKFSSSGTVSSSSGLTAGRPFLAACVNGPSAVRKLLNAGANGFAAVQQRRQLASAGRNCSKNGLGDGGEAVEFFERHLRVALEGRQDLEGFGERLALFGGRVERALAVDDEALELVVAFGERVEHFAGVLDHRTRQRAFLGGEDADQLVGVFDERLQLGEAGVDLFAAAGDPFRERLHPDLEVPARLGVERGQDVVERHRRFDLALGQPAAVGQDGPRPALGDQLHVGLAQQRLLAQDRVHVGADRRVLAGDFERRDGARLRCRASARPRARRRRR